MFTEKETNLLVQLLNQVQIKPTAPDASDVVSTIQSILSKLSTPENE